MPNWCSNTMTIRHNDLGQVMSAMYAWNSGEFLRTLLPIPPDLDIKAGWFGDTPEQRELEKKEQANLAKYGFKNWYDWCIAEWGTKWDVGFTEAQANKAVLKDKGFTVWFDSAWSPPTKAYDKLTEMGFLIDAFYYEGGMGFCGHYLEGTDSHYDIKDFSAKWVKENIPAYIDEEMWISSQLEDNESLED